MDRLKCVGDSPITYAESDFDLSDGESDQSHCQSINLLSICLREDINRIKLDINKIVNPTFKGEKESSLNDQAVPDEAQNKLVAKPI